MGKTYAINEIFYTLQGEGMHAGTPAVFIRLAGCNLWRNTTETRAADAVRNDAFCPNWCDTDFAPYERLAAADIRDRVREILTNFLVGKTDLVDALPLIVFTGGEPLLQLDEELFDLVAPLATHCAIETNGTKPLPDVLVNAFNEGELTVSCSPKVPPEHLKLEHISELKVVFPEYDPEAYLAHFTRMFGGGSDEIADLSQHLYIQALAQPARTVGKSSLVPSAMAQAARWVMEHPEWKLSLQTHKILGLR